MAYLVNDWLRYADHDGEVARVFFLDVLYTHL